MHPFLHTRTHPEKPAYIIAESGEVVTYAALDQRSNQGAHLFRSLGIKRGDGFIWNGSATAVNISFRPKCPNNSPVEKLGCYPTCYPSVNHRTVMVA